MHTFIVKNDGCLKKKWLEFYIIRGKHEIRPQRGPK